MEHLPKDQNLDKFIDADKEEGASAPRLARSDIEQQIKNAEASQSIEAHLVLVDKYLSGEHFSEAGQSIERAKEIIELLPGDFEQKAHFDQGLSRREQLLADLKGKLVANADISAIVAHLGHGDLRDIGSSIDMKLKDVEQREVDLTNQNKKMYDELTATQESLSRKLNGLNLLFILLVVLLAGLFVGGYLLRDTLFVSNAPLATPDAGHEEFVNLRSTVESVVTGVLTIPSTPTPVDLTSIEARLDEIFVALTPMPTTVITSVVATTATITPTTISLPSIVVSAQITPTIKNVNEEGEFVLTNLDYWFDVPDFEISLDEDSDFSFQPDEDENRYEIVNTKNDNLGTFYAQVWQGTNLIHEYTYPFLEDAFSESNSKRLQINWANTTFPLLPPGQYELRLVTKRDLVQEPIAMVGEVQSFVIKSSIEVEVYDPTTNGGLPTRLRTHPLWDCGQACADDEALATSVQILGYAIVPFEEDGGLPYKLPVTNDLGFTPVISFTNQVTTKEVDGNQEPIVINPGENVSPSNVNDYAGQDGILYVVSNADAKFFLVRIPDTREYYWLGEIDILQFYDPDIRKNLLALPVFTVTEDDE